MNKTLNVPAVGDSIYNWRFFILVLLLIGDVVLISMFFIFEINGLARWNSSWAVVALSFICFFGFLALYENRSECGTSQYKELENIFSEDAELKETLNLNDKVSRAEFRVIVELAKSRISGRKFRDAKNAALS